MQKIGTALLLVSMLGYCADGEYEKSMLSEEKVSDNSGIETAEDEEAKLDDADKRTQGFSDLVQVKHHMEAAEWEKAIQKAQNLRKDGYLSSNSRQELDQIIETAMMYKERSDFIAEKILYIEDVMREGDYETAEIAIGELWNNKEIPAVYNQFRDQLDSLSRFVAGEMKRQQDVKIAAEIEPAAPAIAKKNTSSKRDYYFQKLNAVEASLSDLEHLYEGGITDQIKEAVIETNFRWDKLLNEIYGELKIQLSATEVDNLRIEQRKWITYRDSTASKNSAEFEGGSFESVTYIETQGALTKERCYELVKFYMK